MEPKRRIDVDIEHTPDFSWVKIEAHCIDGNPMSGQDVLDVVAETLLLKWDHYDLESAPGLDS